MSLKAQVEARRRNETLAGWRYPAMLFAVFFAFIGLCALWLQMGQAESARRLTEEGADSIAIIVAKYTDTSSSSDSESGVTSYHLEYEFPLADGGASYEGDDSVSSERYAQIKIGDEFPVRYWRTDPDIATILPNAFDAGADALRTISLTLLSLSAVLGALVLIRPIRRRIERSTQ